MEGEEKTCFFDVGRAVELRQQRKIVAEAIGTLSHSSTQELVLGPPFLLSREQAEYLHLTQPSDSVRSAVFAHFCDRGYYVVSGAAYGCDFLLYRHDPLLAHATAMVFIEDCVTPQRLVEVTRLAALCKKTCLITTRHNSTIAIKEIERVGTSRGPLPLPRVRE